MATVTFDTHKYIKTLEDGGIPPAQAEALVQAQRESLQAAFDYRELATKTDIQEVKTVLAETKAEIIKWVVGLIFMQTAIITALMVKLAK